MSQRVLVSARSRRDLASDHRRFDDLQRRGECLLEPLNELTNVRLLEVIVEARLSRPLLVEEEQAWVGCPLMTA
jgi:hypothetical protein